MMKLMKLLAGVALAGVLAACGGGGGSPGATPGNGGANGPSPTSKVADFAVTYNKTSLTSGGTDSAIITVVAVDSGGNVVSGATVTVATGAGAVFTPSGGATTDATGTYRGTIALGSDKSDRTLNVTVTSNGITRNSTLLITGSKLTIQAAPTSPSPGQAVVLTLQLSDGSGAGIPNTKITMGGTVPGLTGTTQTTDSNGKAVINFNAPTTAGIYKISAVGSGVSSGDYQLQVFSTVIPPASIPAGVLPALSASPNVIAANSPGATSSRSTIRFLMLNSQNGPIPNVRVKFLDATSGLPLVGAALANAGVTLFTDASGSVATDYIAGQNPSPTNGVQIRACYSGNDFTSATDCPNSVLVTLTVAGQALAVSIGDDNLLIRGDGTYIKKFAISVADAAGKPVVNAPVDISVDLTHYGKASGLTSATNTFTAVPSNLNASATINVTSSTSSGSGSSTATTTQTFAFVWCPNEDTNRNGFVDPGENVNNSIDSNGQATLEPRKADLLISYFDPAKTVTDASGLLQIQVQYSQRFATWLAYRVRVIANVQGSQGIAERLFVTDFIEGDQRNGSFLNPPYGFTPSCTVAN